MNTSFKIRVGQLSGSIESRRPCVTVDGMNRFNVSNYTTFLNIIESPNWTAILNDTESSNCPRVDGLERLSVFDSKLGLLSGPLLFIWIVHFETEKV